MTAPLRAAERVVREPVVLAGAVRVRALPLARGLAAGAAWDDFARLCGASIHGSSDHIRLWAARHGLSHRVRLFELHAETASGSRKVGQCAVGVARAGRSKFLDRLHLEPGSEALWDLAMAAALAETGAGAYEYGGEWSLETSRESALRRMAGVSVEASRGLIVQAIDFGRWSSWEDYYRGVVGNVRRAANAATRRYPNLMLDRAQGLATMANVPTLVRLRAQVYRRKGLAFEWLAFLLSKAAFTVLCSRHVIAGHAHADRRALGAFYGAEFGANTYYLDGASASGNAGASWRLLMSMIERAFDRTPQGRFVMGFVDYARHDEAIGGGLLRSRRACQVTDFPTAVVQFRYAG